MKKEGGADPDFSSFSTVFDRFSPPVENRGGSVVTADQELRRDLMITICTYVPLFTRWKEHRVQATARVMEVWVSVILRLVKTIFQIGGEAAKLKYAARMRPDSFSTPVERGRKGVKGVHRINGEKRAAIFRADGVLIGDDRTHRTL
ncbi:hypothetical protein [Methanofollis sp. UBA420]|jgi:hypothetical protein|uniref:hypothetical protein n=1 Tax=Methanofollis sp. UBA420 TaxID=1915514 RepID=UPI00316AE571